MGFFDGVGSAIATGLSGFGSALFGYNSQKRENEITREREDTAITRQVADLRNAGLSPLMANGNGASAQSLTAPSFNFDGVAKGVQQAIAIKQANAQIDLMKAQADNFKAQKILTELQSDWGSTFGFNSIDPTTAVISMFYNGLKDGVIDPSNFKSDGLYGKALSMIGGFLGLGNDKVNPPSVAGEVPPIETKKGLEIPTVRSPYSGSKVEGYYNDMRNFVRDNYKQLGLKKVDVAHAYEMIEYFENQNQPNVPFDAFINAIVEELKK